MEETRAERRANGPAEEVPRPEENEGGAEGSRAREDSGERGG